MTDKELQDVLDQLGLGGAREARRPDDTDDRDTDFRAYQLLYDALEEEPDGTLPPHFAQQVVDRVMPAHALESVAERYPWIEWVLPPLVLVAAFVATFLLLPTATQTGAESLQRLIEPMQVIWTTLRLDLVLAAGGTLLLVGLFDRLFRRARIRSLITQAS